MPWNPYLQSKTVRLAIAGLRFETQWAVSRRHGKCYDNTSFAAVSFSMRSNKGV